MNSTPACNKPSASILCSMVNTSGSTRTTPTTSASLATLRSRFRLSGTNSKIPGFAIRGSVPNFHGLTALVVMSSVAARFFTPQVAGAGANPSAPTGVFRIDHDEHFNQTTHLQYQPWKKYPWVSFNWRYDSGLVAGATPCFGVLATNNCPGSILLGGVPNVSLVASNVGSVPLSADQEFEAGFTCNGMHATPPARQIQLAHP